MAVALLSVTGRPAPEVAEIIARLKRLGADNDAVMDSNAFIKEFHVYADMLQTALRLTPVLSLEDRPTKYVESVPELGQKCEFSERYWRPDGPDGFASLLMDCSKDNRVCYSHWSTKSKSVYWVAGETKSRKFFFLGNRRQTCQKPKLISMPMLLADVLLQRIAMP